MIMAHDRDRDPVSSAAPARRLPPTPRPSAVVDPRIGDLGPALLALEDGSIFPGVAFGAPVASGGDLVVNTSQTGYQEVCTDPSYAGQVVVMTYPLIGNYGRLVADDQSLRPWLRGLVVANATAAVLDDARQLATLLRRAGIPAIAGVDTRGLARHLRAHGSLRGVIMPPGSLDEACCCRGRTRRSSLGGPGLRRAGVPGRDHRARQCRRGRSARRRRRLRAQGQHHPEPRASGASRSGAAAHEQSRRGARFGHRGRRPLARPGRSGSPGGPDRARPGDHRRRPATPRHLPGPPDRGPRRRCRNATPSIRASRRQPPGAGYRPGARPGHRAEPRGPGRRGLGFRRGRAST